MIVVAKVFKTPKFYTIKEIAEILKVTRQRVHQILEEKKIAKFYRTEGRILIRKKDVEELLKIKRMK